MCTVTVCSLGNVHSELYIVWAADLCNMALGHVNVWINLASGNVRKGKLNLHLEDLRCDSVEVYVPWYCDAGC